MAFESVVSQMTGEGRTFSAVVVTQASAAWFTLKAASSGKIPKLHAFIATGDTAATTITFQSADDSSGTTPVALSGAIILEQYGGAVIPFTADVRGCLTAPISKSLGFTSATGLVKGYAIVSTD